MKSKKLAKTFLIVCAVLCVALILAQFIPFWTYTSTETGTSETISIFEYLIYPGQHTDVTSELDSGSKEAINSLAGTFVLILLLGFVSIIFTVLKSDKLWICLFHLIVGIGSLIGYLTEPRWQLSGNYIVLVVLSTLLTICAAVVASTWIRHISYWFMDPKDVPNK